MSTVSQLLHPALPYMPNASRTKEKQTLATPRCGPAVIFNTSSPTGRSPADQAGTSPRWPDWRASISSTDAKERTTKGTEKHRLGSPALTRNEAKSMSTRLLAGESFAIFQIKAGLCFAFRRDDYCIICRGFGWLNK